MRDQLIRSLEEYKPFTEQEEQDREEMLSLLRVRPDIFTRNDRLCHMTASAWTVNDRLDRVLMAYHNIYRSYSWLGGHADGEEDLLGVALREVKEESGITRVRPLTEKIFSLEVLTVDGHEKRGVYVPSHLHLNVTYLLEADEREPLKVKADENSALEWFTPEGAVISSSEPWFRERIYKKLNRKLELFRGEKK